MYMGWTKKVAIIENMVNVVLLLLENRKIIKYAQLYILECMRRDIKYDIEF